tara:strand:- start:283 stop:582 length:300 start_codon:yes stop_codon:yes gene_type:complete
MDLKFTTAGEYMSTCTSCGGKIEEKIQIDFHHIHSVRKTSSEWKEILGEKFSGKNLKRLVELDENLLKKLGKEILENGAEENRFRVTTEEGGDYEILIK